MDDKDKIKERTFQDEVAKAIALEEKEKRAQDFAQSINYLLETSKFYLPFKTRCWGENIETIRQIPLLSKFYKFFEECRLVDRWTMFQIDPKEDEIVEIVVETSITGITQELRHRFSLRHVELCETDFVVHMFMQKIAHEVIEIKIKECLR